MKKYIILSICCASVLMTACKEWLTVYPEDEVAEGELFENGEGYRTALNGIYQQLSEEPLYGKNLTYGVLEAMGQVYDKEYFGTTNYTMQDASDLKYDNIVSTIDEVWSEMYNSIANCNNLIQHIEHADSNIFEYKHQEKTMIQGEAYALRGFLHFDLLRLFAPSVAVDNGAKYMPYCTTYPVIWAEYKTVHEVLDLVLADLHKARELAAQDTLEENVGALNNVYNRIDNGHGWPERGTFWRMRGTHMNYHNITALLARVYLYADSLDKAYEYAQEVLAFKGEYDYMSAYEYPASYSYAGNTKSKDDILLAFFNTLVTQYHEVYFNPDATMDGGYLAIRHYTDLFTDLNDYRYSQMTSSPQTGIRVSIKYREDASESNERVNGPLIPILRKGEMVYIVAEYMAKHGDIQGACDFIDTELRQNRGCVNPLPNVSTEREFLEQMLLDARRELLEEGQIFFMHKRLNMPFWDGNNNAEIDATGKWIWDTPDSENI